MRLNKNQIWNFIRESNKIEGIDLQDNCTHTKNSFEAVDYVVENFDTLLGVRDAMVLHELQMYNLVDETDLGIFRRVDVGIKRTTIDADAMIENFYSGGEKPMSKTEFISCAPVEVLEKKMGEFIDSFNNSTLSNLDLHYEFECIHPFIDGNGRVGRLLWLWKSLQEKSSNILMLENYEGCDFYERRKCYYNAIQKYREERFGKGRSTKRRSNTGASEPRSQSHAEDARGHV